MHMPLTMAMQVLQRKQQVEARSNSMAKGDKDLRRVYADMGAALKWMSTAQEALYLLTTSKEQCRVWGMQCG